MSKTVWVLTIEHRHGRDTLAFERKTAAEGHLFDYVKKWWSKAVGDHLPMPEDPQLAIETYFDGYAQDESADIVECLVDDGMPSPPAKPKKREIPICSECGSADVVFDAYAAWDRDRQKMELSAEFDQAYCEGKCEGECSVDWVPLTPELQAELDAKELEEAEN